MITTREDREAASSRARYNEGVNGSPIPEKQVFCVSMRGGEQIKREIRGKYFFRMDEGYFKIIDPHGAGVIQTIERGLVGRFEAYAA